ncbi:MAG: tail fiber domain-containing protein [Flavobacteriales bacterium]|nr:tail fiber domain-containing protein [Flavobacteriales bacterium]
MKTFLKTIAATSIVIAFAKPTTLFAQNIFPTPTGNVGIGTVTPADLLEVSGGDIHISTSTRAYRLGGNNFLWHGGNAKNLFAGVNVGNATLSGEGNILVGSATASTLTSGDYNTIMGLTSGNNLTTGNYNSFYGESSGHENTSGSENTFVGDKAGYSNATGSALVAFGTYAGYSNTVSDNTFMGYEAGRNTTTGTENTFIGFNAGKGNATGNYNTVTGYQAGGLGGVSYNHNTIYGTRAGKDNTTGGINTFIGYSAGASNTTGGYSVAVGALAGSNSTTGRNMTCVGYLSGQNTTTAYYNTFMGYHAGRYNTTGGYNTAIGTHAGGQTSTGTLNTFLGMSSGYANTSGTGNTAIGHEAGNSYATGTYNTFLGYQADANGNYSNAAAIGRGAIAIASNTMSFGNASITNYYNTTGLWTISDGRFKFNVNENVSGLDFIERLRPVTYQMNTQALDEFVREDMPQPIDTGQGAQASQIDFGPSTAMIHAGFIAQEVEEAAIQSGFISSIVSTPTHDNSPYAVSYAQIVVPLVKAVQEQQDSIENLAQRMGQLEDALTQMQDALLQCCGSSNAQYKIEGENNLHRVPSITVELSSSEAPVLYQNRPNPFTDGTVIAYYLPKGTHAAMLVFHGQSGQTLLEIPLTDRGHASISLQTDRLTAGIYTYSLVADGLTVETKRMVKGK